MAVSTGKAVEVLLGEAVETFETQEQMLPLVNFMEPDPEKMQNSSNFIWQTLEQQRPLLSGWDLTGQEQGIIEEEYPSVLGVPSNDLVQVRADDLRDIRYWKRSGQASGRKQASGLNKAITSAMITQAGMHYRSNATSGYDFIAEGQALMNERQGAHSQRCFLLNDRTQLKYSKDLAARQTLQGRPESVWTKGQIGENIAEFNVYTGSYLDNVTGGAASTTVTGLQSFAPEGGSVDPVTGVCTNVDYRSAVITVADSSSFAVGDKVTFDNVFAVGLDDKTVTSQLMTFPIVEIPSGTSVRLFIKPIAADDGALSDLEKAYANVNTQIANGVNMTRVNTDASVKANLFWDKDAIEVLGGTIPAHLFKELSGLKVVNQSMKNGQKMYIVYDGDLATMNFRYRLFTWYGITACDPSRIGLATDF